MARQIIQLNNTKISTAKPQEKDYTLSDGQGLYLLIKTNGSKLWRFNYYDLLKKRKLISLGSYPEISLLEARTKRDEYRSLLAKGIDPQDYIFKQKEQAVFNQSNTLISVAQDWRKMKSSKVEADTMRDQWRLLELHLFPHLGNMPISEITAPFTRMKLQKLADEKKFEMLKKVIRGLNEIMRFAVNGGLIQFNPTANIQELFPSGEVQHRPSIHP
ncbi:integrase arm-type DNA-binding domain-containing protein, partial [Avibacterium paragallinarum]